MRPSKFDPPVSFNPGLVATVEANGVPAGTIGGARWKSSGGHPDLDRPLLLATVDLASPALQRCVGDVGAIEIPLFSHVAFDGLIPLQHYRLDYSARIASFDLLREKVEMLPVEYRLPNPLPESVLRVRDMRSEEIPRDEDSYWVAIDTFLGGEGALRIGGAPVFVDYIESPAKGFRYFASLGYEGYDRKDGFLRGEALFLGEVAHYFFVSPDWTEVQVISQAT